MGAQVGILSAFQLGIHDHLSNERGGILNAYSRYGAYRTPFRTGALAVNCPNDTERSTANVVYALLKEIRINALQPGRYRIAWQARSNDMGLFIKTRFYVNGVAISAEMDEDSDVYQDELHNYDVDLAAGDLLQIYGKRVGATTCYVRNFRIYYDWGISYFGDGTFNNLVTLLPLSDVTPLDFTAVL